MILTRAPLRITLGGGGTDLEPYCSEHGGFCVSAAINQYVYVSVLRPFLPGIYLKYSEIERAVRVEDVEHPIIRRALELFEETRTNPQIEITTVADIPAGTGLGSSSSFTVALLFALAAFYNKNSPVSMNELADTAIQIERSVALTGRQDQYSAAYGGLSLLRMGGDNWTQRFEMRLSPETMKRLHDRLLLFYTGVMHNAPAALVGQGAATDNLHRIKDIGVETAQALSDGAFEKLGGLFNQQWDLKEARHPSPLSIHGLRARALSLFGGANGVKLIGAGEGGFLLCDTDEPDRLRQAMKGLAAELSYQLDTEGAKVLLS